ncbi:hypothetical protein [uncultured Treponema sp.]|uniref:hypothetical protein n=1 Tax=uncultured Treponema sp. TaxID=162155 RepID=UPI0025E1B91A|nr:hypothetical protein [uncultured Treponema sp.]
MKRLLAVLGISTLLFAGILFTSCGEAEGDTFYATTTIGTPDVSAKAYPGVNILTWKEIKDAGSYTVYRTVGNGKIEEAGVSASNSYYDTDIDEGVTYKYRVVANPLNTAMHDASQTEVSLTTAKTATDKNIKGTWAPTGTLFSDLAQYEKDYNANDEVLSADTINVKVLADSKASVRISFPTKPYAKYTVYLTQENGGLLASSTARETSKTIKGYDYNGTASLTLDALYSGKKQIMIYATPLNDVLYGRSRVISSAIVEVKDFNAVASATASSVSAKWTNYDYYKKVADARVYFNPYIYQGEEFATSEYTIYRAVYSNSEELSVTDASGSDLTLKSYDSITELGSPKKDTAVDVNGLTVYYLDDSFEISDIAGVRYFVVLNHNGSLKSNSSRIKVPNDSDSDWNFTTDSTTVITNDADIYDIYIENDGIFYLKANTSYSGTLSVTYGTFSTLNEAKVAVESELPNKLTNSYSYATYTTYTGVKVNTNKYYAFRVLSTRSSTADDVATTIAIPVKEGGTYYWDIKTTQPSNYAYETVSTPSLTLKSDVGTSTYNNITLNYYASNAKYYNIYRCISNYSNTPYSYEFELLATITDSTYTDSGVSGKSISSKYIFYKVEAVGYYNASESSVTKASALATPILSRDSDGKTLSWNDVTGASTYCLYRAKTEDELKALYASEYFTSTTSTSYSDTQSYSSDYYYAVRAYDYSDYSNLSTSVKVQKATLEAPSVSMDLYSYNGSTCTWNLTWDSVSGYSNNYYILRYTDSTGNETEESVKAMFTANPDSYNYGSTYSRYYQISNASSYNKMFAAVATEVYDNIERKYVYSFEDVFEIDYTLKTGSTLNVSSSGSAYDLSWDAMENAVSYAVYYYGSYSQTLYASSTSSGLSEDILSGTGSMSMVTTVDATLDASTETYSYTGSTNSYNFFTVVGFDSEGNPINMTNIVRVR